MYKGKIIKFYRQKANLTQEQLGYEICSNTHVSKIERGMTEYSSDVISLLSKRLGINIEEEIERYKNIKKHLSHWHDAMIKERDEEVERIKEELENEPLILISDYQILYGLLQARYHLQHQNHKQAHKIMKAIQNKHKHIPPYESNLLKHLFGIYYLSVGDVKKAFTFLVKINGEDYNNLEYYLTLATTHLAAGSKVMAYYYAEKSLKFFINSNNFLKVIDAEMIMLMTRDNDGHSHFQKKVREYYALIQNCDLCHAIDKKAQLLHNLAREYYNNNEYKSAKRLYEQSMDLKDEKTIHYLISLEGYIRSCLDGNLLSNSNLVKLTKRGLSIAREINENYHTINFRLLLYLINNDHDEYYKYLITDALPYYKMCGYGTLEQQYEKELFHYYLKSEETEKALKMAVEVM